MEQFFKKIRTAWRSVHIFFYLLDFCCRCCRCLAVFALQLLRFSAPQVWNDTSSDAAG